MQAELVIHQQTAEQIERFIAQPSHALLLIGADGVGKGMLARHLTARILELADAHSAETSHAVSIIAPDEKQTISIEAIRTLQRFLKLKTAGKKQIRRVVIVEHAQGLTTEAQNAFLKLLEEPPADTLIILTAPNKQALLPTILSRVQTVSVMEPTKDQLLTFFGNYPQAAVTQTYFLSGGLPGLMKALLDEDSEHTLVQAVTRAKALLQQDLFTRLISVEQISKQKSDVQQLCVALHRIAHTALEQAAVKNDVRRIAQWQRIIKAVSNAQKMLAANANTKLTLTQLMLQLSS